MPHAPLTHPVAAHWTPDARWIRLLLAVLVLLAVFVAGVPGPPIHAATITVDTLSDNPASGLTLREAIDLANGTTGVADEIMFTVSGTITLTSGLPTITDDLTITGPGAGAAMLTVSGDDSFLPFEVEADVMVAISGLTIANGNSAVGGGILNSGTLEIMNSTIANNVSSGSGGGITNLSGGSTLTITNSTVADNTANGFGSGGGIFNSGTLIVRNSTIAGNGAFIGGGIFNGGRLTLNSTIVATNTGVGVDIFNDTSALATIDAVNFSLIGDTGGNAITMAGTGGNGPNIVGTAGDLADPGFVGGSAAVLADNGGPTQTLALASGSPAIDKGTANGLTTDQRGFTRTVDDDSSISSGDDTDIGAYEFDATLPVAAPTANDDPNGGGAFPGTEDMDLTIPIATLLGNDVANAGTLDEASFMVMDGTNGTTAITGTDVVYTPGNDTNGMDTFTYTISNTMGGGPSMATVTVDITAVNDPPSFTKGADVEVNQGMVAYDMAWATNILPGPANENAQNVSFMVTNNSNMSLFSAPPAVNGVTGNLTFTPMAGMSGTAAITLVAKDDGGDMDTSGPETLNINVNAPPAAMNDLYNVVVDTILDATTAGNRLLDNDDATDGPTLILTMADANPSLGAFGTVPQANGAFTFNANGLNVGNVATFMYTVADGAATPLEDTAMVTITVVAANQAPTPGANPTFMTQEDIPLAPGAGALLVNFNDPDNGPNTPLVTVMATNTATTLGGTVDIATDGSFTYTPLLNTAGPDTFPFTVSDGVAMVAGTAEVMITPVNDPPVAMMDTGMVDEDMTLMGLDLAGNDMDVDGAVVPSTVVVPAMSTQGGTITNNNNGTVNYTPPPNFNGLDMFTYTIDDDGTPMPAQTSADGMVEITVNPINDPPTGNADTYVVRVGQTLDVPAPGLLGNDIDIDIEIVALNLVGFSPLQVGTNANTGMFDIDPDLGGDGSFRFIAPPTPGTVTFTYDIEDNGDGTDLTKRQDTLIPVTITVIPIPPVDGTMMDGEEPGQTDGMIGMPLIEKTTISPPGTATSGDGFTSVTIPAGAVDDGDSVGVFVTGLGTVDLMANGTPQPPGTFLVGGMAFNITLLTGDGEIITDFGEPITIVLKIDLAGRPPGGLAVFFFNTRSGKWETIQAMVAADGTVTIVINHLTLFAVFEVGSVSQPFAAGFSAITFTGPSGTDAGPFAASLGADVGAIWRWDAAAQDWEGFFPDAPAALSTLETLSPRDVLFVRSSASGTYTSTNLLPEAADRTATLVPGFTFLSFNGPDGTAVADLLAGNPALAVAFLFDAATQGWLGFYPAQPFLNGFTTLDRLAGIFVRNDSNSSVDITLPEIGVG